MPEFELSQAAQHWVNLVLIWVGFGALVLARHPAMYSIGLTVLLGISAAVPTAVLVIPAFRVKRPNHLAVVAILKIIIPENLGKKNAGGEGSSQAQSLINGHFFTLEGFR